MTPVVRSTQVARGAARAARLGLLALAVVGLGFGDATAVSLAVVFLLGSLAVARLARPVLDACFAAVLVAHGWGVLLGPANTIAAWGPIMHVAAPTLVALTVGLAVTDAALPARPSSRSAALGAALVGGVLVIVGWEILEAALNEVSGVYIHTGRGDTVDDLALGVVGTVAGVCLAYALLRRGRTRET
jgi:hypothetical protein